MEICIIPPSETPPAERAYTVSMVIRNFKGRKDVEVHLFRPVDQATFEAENDSYPWGVLLDDPLNPNMEYDPLSARRVIMEAFTEAERDKVVDYLKQRYADKLESINSCVLDFPIPLGLTALSDLSEGKSVGFIHLDRTPNYALGLALRGYFDLSAHRPLIETKEEE
jgi:hypothetical protein